jgi:hypothetical protein
MKGILLKTTIGWNISYDDVLNISPDHNRVVAKKIISLSEKEPYNKVFLSTLAGDEFVEVDFEIVEEYVEPEGIHCNRGGFVERAKISEPGVNNWDDIMKILSNPDASWGTKEAMVRERYESPIKKINNGKESR